ncbi:hypothetical protein O181_031219 [Austropuccinia psidii MF-1]|uniref:Reverse transcriptase domain-containing protein n=1 Tax=Austropuccinia psidii MF-1 TaxID=1389203 RepID=A0A9Q3CUF3_9BASI|nr:hypothetical protein [Austropuccinia psidii MF-1]
MNVFVDHAPHPLMIDSGAHFSIVSREYMDKYFPNWEKKLLPTKAKSFKSPSGKMKSIGTTIKEIIIPHRKGNIRLNPEFVVLEDAHIQGFLLGNDYQRMYGIDIYNSKNRDIAIGTNNLLKILRKNRPASSIVEEPLCKFRGHYIELYLDVERPHSPILRRPPYIASLEARKEIEKHINELLYMGIIRKIGHNEIVEITAPFLLTWNDGKSRFCGDFRALNNYTKADRYPIPRIPHALDKFAKAKYITEMDCMECFHQNRFKLNPMKLLIIIFHMGIYEYTRMPFGTQNAPAHFQRMVDKISQEILEG